MKRAHAPQANDGNATTDIVPTDACSSSGASATKDWVKWARSTPAVPAIALPEYKTIPLCPYGIKFTLNNIKNALTFSWDAQFLHVVDTCIMARILQAYSMMQLWAECVHLGFKDKKNSRSARPALLMQECASILVQIVHCMLTCWASSRHIGLSSKLAWIAVKGQHDAQ